MAATAPRIGVAWPRPDYLTSLEQAGAVVRVLEAATDRLPEALADCDGLLLTGGVDVDPREYGEAPHPTVETDTTRDGFELALARLPIARYLPMPAICPRVQGPHVPRRGSRLPGLLEGVERSKDRRIAVAVLTLSQGRDDEGLIARRQPCATV